jgi:hypothetical protein
MLFTVLAFWLVGFAAATLRVLLPSMDAVMSWFPAVSGTVSTLSSATLAARTWFPAEFDALTEIAVVSLAYQIALVSAKLVMKIWAFVLNRPWS